MKLGVSALWAAGACIALAIGVGCSSDVIDTPKGPSLPGTGTSSGGTSGVLGTSGGGGTSSSGGDTDSKEKKSCIQHDGKDNEFGFACITCKSANCNGKTECKGAKDEPVDTCPTDNVLGNCKDANPANIGFVFDIVYYKLSDTSYQGGETQCKGEGGTYTAAP